MEFVLTFRPRSDDYLCLFYDRRLGLKDFNNIKLKYPGVVMDEVNSIMKGLVLESYSYKFTKLEEIKPFSYLFSESGYAEVYTVRRAFSKFVHTKYNMCGAELCINYNAILQAWIDDGCPTWCWMPYNCKTLYNNLLGKIFGKE